MDRDLLNKLPNVTLDNEQPLEADEQSNPYGRFNEGWTTGLVIDAWAQYNCYLIQLEIGLPTLATAITNSSNNMASYREHHLYSPGTYVAVYRPGNSSTFYITGSIPSPVVDYKFNSPDHILESGGSHKKDDEAHNAIQNTADKGGIKDYNENRPFDVRSGEYGWMNSLGVGGHYSFGAFLQRASGLAQIEGFYLNNYLRITGYNYSLHTSHSEVYSGEDEGENVELVRSSPFPWEMKGLTSHGDKFTREKEEKNTRAANQVEADYEPLKDDQLGVFRKHHFGGYLGDLEKTIYATPSGNFTQPETLSSDNIYTGLAEKTVHSNGLLEFRSAKGIVLEKNTYIPVPKQKSELDSPDGDKNTEEENQDYQFAGAWGEVKEEDSHTKKDFEPSDPRHAQLQAFEMLSHLHQSYGLKVIHRHKKDWKITSEKEHPDLSNKPVASDYVRPAKDEIFKDPPQPFNIQIDHRQGNSNFYRGRSRVELMDNGGVVLEDSWGSQVEMFGGNIKISCPGDIQLTPGRDLIGMAPNDLNIKAGKNIDLTTSEQDIRLKAQRNLTGLAGNDADEDGEEITGKGGIILESRGTAVPEFGGTGDNLIAEGITLYSKESPAKVYGDDIYLRSQSGDIVCDAASGDQNIQLYASKQISYLKFSKEELFGTDPALQSEPDAVAYMDTFNVRYTQAGTFYTSCANFIHDGTSTLLNSQLVVKSVAAQDSDNGKLYAWTNQTQSTVNRAVTQGDRIGESSLAQSQQKPASNSNMPYSEGGSGTDQFIEKLGFSMRTDKQYLVDYSTDETRWQQYFRIYGTSSKAWPEPAIKAPSGELTGPYPGYKAWNEDKDRYNIQSDFTHWDPNTGELIGPLDSNKPGKVDSDKPLAERYLVGSIK